MLLSFPRSVGSGGSSTSPTFSVNRNLVVAGDSISHGFGATEAWPNLTATFFSKTATIKFHDGSGFLVDGGTGTLTANASEVDALLASPPQTFVVHAGSADFRGAFTVTDVINAMSSYVSGRITAGYLASRFIIGTALPRSGLDETTRGNFNTAVVSLAASLGVSCARFDLDPNIGVAGAQTNTTYYQGDQTHPTNAGQEIMAGIIEGIMA
jgi:lysophospholipase L1-like esterase